MPPKKNSNKPKGRSSAYAFFVKERRAESRARGQDVQFAQFSKDCADEWKEVDKKPFEKKAAEDKVRYDTEMAAFRMSEGATGKRRRPKKEKDPNMPKRGM